MNGERRLSGRQLPGAIAPSLFMILVGHVAAGVVFWFTFRQPALRPIWLAQYYVLLLLSLLLMLYAISLRKQLFRIIALLNVLIVHIVLGYPEGDDLRCEAVLGTAFVVVSMLEIQGPVAYVLSFGYSFVLAVNQLPITAWGVPIPAPSVFSTVLLSAYLCFLAWLCGLVGNRGHRIREQQAEISRLDRTVTALSNANLDFQEWAAMVQHETEVQERKRIAREIHDIVGYTLTNIQIMMEAATDLSRTDPAGLESLLLKTRDQAQRGLIETRRAMRNVRSIVGVRSNGIRRIQEVVRIFSNATRVPVDLHVGNSPASFGALIDETLYRMVQESLTNSFRHGNASHITVGFWVVNRVLRVTITDDGVGAKEILPGVGLSGMSERLGHVKGTLKAESTPFGFRVYAEIPLQPEESHEENTRITG